MATIYDRGGTTFGGLVKLHVSGSLSGGQGSDRQRNRSPRVSEVDLVIRSHSSN